jgi:hypothetical protein
LHANAGGCATSAKCATAPFSSLSLLHVHISGPVEEKEEEEEDKNVYCWDIEEERLYVETRLLGYAFRGPISTTI